VHHRGSQVVALAGPVTAMAAFSEAQDVAAAAGASRVQNDHSTSLSSQGLAAGGASRTVQVGNL